MNGHCKEFFPTIRLIITHNYGCKSKKRIITIGFGVMYMRLLSHAKKSNKKTVRDGG